jgi:hypothetical protein
MYTRDMQLDPQIEFRSRRTFFVPLVSSFVTFVLHES